MTTTTIVGGDDAVTFAGRRCRKSEPPVHPPTLSHHFAPVSVSRSPSRPAAVAVVDAWRRRTPWLPPPACLCTEDSSSVSEWKRSRVRRWLCTLTFGKSSLQACWGCGGEGEGSRLLHCHHLVLDKQVTSTTNTTTTTVATTTERLPATTADADATAGTAVDSVITSFASAAAAAAAAAGGGFAFAANLSY